MLRRFAVAIVAALALVGPAFAGAAGDVRREALYAGKLRQGLDQLAAPAFGDDRKPGLEPG